MRILALVAAALVLSPFSLFSTSHSYDYISAQTSPSDAVSGGETSHLVFVTEFIRELSAMEKIRAIITDGPDDPLTGTVKASGKYVTELEADVKTLKAMRLDRPFQNLISNTVKLYEKKAALSKKIGDRVEVILNLDEKTFKGDPQKLVGEFRDLKAQADEVDQNIFLATTPIFSTLVDRRPDSTRKTTHLIITRAEKAKLLDYLNAEFGAKLDSKDPGFMAGGAHYIRDFLLHFKCSDDPWE